MPLFRRSDGEVIRDLSPVRRMIPYLMKGRTESVVYFEQVIDLTKTLPFIARWNGKSEQKLTLFHLVLVAIARALFARPGINRFVSGGRIYQRKGVQLSFAAKKKFADDAPLSTIKLEMKEGEPLGETVGRIHASIGEGRSDKERTVDKEVRWILKAPHFLVRMLMAFFIWLDKWNLAPGAMLKTDPMYASAFLANLGSVGIDRAWHHLYEYGTVSVFAALGVVRKDLVVGATGQPEVRDLVSIRYSYDERINDGFYAAASLELVKGLLEDPERAT
jgi:2-oxoacid dehydrogenases acyltransferase (catalytic domain)